MNLQNYFSGNNVIHERNSRLQCTMSNYKNQLYSDILRVNNWNVNLKNTIYNKSPK